MIVAGTLALFRLAVSRLGIGSLIGVIELAAMIDYVELMRRGLAKRHGLAARENFDAAQWRRSMVLREPRQITKN